MGITRPLFLILLTILFTVMPYSYGQCKPLSIIRDTELEEYTLLRIKNFFKIAGLDSNSARVIFINDNTINAFVAGGTTIFVHTGLILESPNSDAFFGVLAHETGHIVGGHIVRGYESLKKAQTTAVITTILGGIAAMASGRGDVGMAVIAGGLGTSETFISSYRIAEENAADSTAIHLIQEIGYSPKGLLSITKTMYAKEQLNSTLDEYYYTRTHPLTKERIAFFDNASQNTKPLKNDMEFHLIRAKLFGFLNSSEQTFETYTKNDLPSHYAKSIAYFKQANIQKALEEIQKLIDAQPKNPYFWELKGQVLFETGNISQSVEAYEIAVSLDKEAVLIRLALAHALIENKKPQKAIQQLEYILPRDSYLPEGWFFLSTAYGMTQQQGNAFYALAEYNFLIGNYKEALHKIDQAQKQLQKDAVKLLRLQDLKDSIYQIHNKQPDTF